MNQNLILFPQRLCETLSGNLAYTVGRLIFKSGRPMLVEHVGGIYLEHTLDGCVITPGYAEVYNISYIWEEERERNLGDARNAGNTTTSLQGRNFSHGFASAQRRIAMVRSGLARDITDSRISRFEKTTTHHQKEPLSDNL